MQVENLMTIQQWVDKYKYYTVPAIRNLIARNKNGFNDMVVFKVGKKILLKPDAFTKWVESQNSFDGELNKEIFLTAAFALAKNIGKEKDSDYILRLSTHMRDYMAKHMGDL